jgi:hypothetical protein
MLRLGCCLSFGTPPAPTWRLGTPPAPTWRLGPASVLGTPYAHVALPHASVLGTPLRVRGAWAALGGNHARSPLGDT